MTKSNSESESSSVLNFEIEPGFSDTMNSEYVLEPEKSLNVEHYQDTETINISSFLYLSSIFVFFTSTPNISTHYS